MDGRDAGAAQLPAGDKYVKMFAAWQIRFDVWKGKFRGSSLLAAWNGEDVLSHPPVPPQPPSRSTLDKMLTADRAAVYKMAAAEQAANYAQWEARNAPRHKKRKQQNRPDNDGAQATKRRLESEELRERHREREQERRAAAEPEPTAEEVQEAERVIKYAKKQRVSAKALAAAHANLQVSASPAHSSRVRAPPSLCVGVSRAAPSLR